MQEKIIFGLEPMDKQSGQTKTTLEISLSIEDLQKFLFRFSPNEIKIQDYIIYFRGEYILISMDRDTPPYVVTNRDQVYNLAVQAYSRLVATQLFRNAISFDFDAANDLIYNNIDDEFGDSSDT
ncbi:MAG: hypothetical protein IKR19_08920 [Acholeplasmatales bacterium]|nr:hypothetical protein [Acholeplasmatales bacterium]